MATDATDMATDATIDETGPVVGPDEAGRVDWPVLRAVVARDLTAIARSKAVLLPILILPFVLLVLLPLAVATSATNPNLEVDQVTDLMPGRLAEQVLAVPGDERLIVLILGYLVAPLFLVVPLMVSAVLAADTFAGEKERKTLEALLHLPAKARDLYLAKLLGAFLPALAVSWVGFVLFATVSNAASWPIMERLFLPTERWMVLILWVAPASAALGLGLMVRISIRANNTQEAQQLGGAVVLPLTVLAVGQASYLLLYPTWASLAVGAVLWAIAVELNRRGAKAFTRERMAARL